VSNHIELGLGIIGLGKLWGHRPGEVPSEADAISLLEFAFNLGIRYFDSAASYGIAEERLGKFLRLLTAPQRNSVRIATKFGEHWNPDANEPFVDHSFDALRRSLDRSLEYLGKIDLLQLHKTTPDVLQSNDLVRAWEYAASAGIETLGASVSDLESARITIADSRFRCIQLPLNRENARFSGAVHDAASRSMWVATNRPFAMGAMLYRDQPVPREEAFRFVLTHDFTGVVLTGTKSKQHLQENWQSFRNVQLAFA
jgi:aryl-alcohol dehydrogenase-like predicted oxidoreductase